MAAVRMTAADEAKIHQTVRDAGGRLTVPTRMVVSILAASDEHLTADGLIAELDKRITGIAPSTVYRVIQRLTELEILEHVHSGNGPDFYHLSLHGHAHLVCSSCGSITDIPNEIFERLAGNIQKSYRFEIEPHHSALLGTCADCQG